MDIQLFLGRFHPLVVHLPIGFLILAAIMEGLSISIKNKYNDLNRAISIALFCGGMSAVGAAIIGHLLAGGGGYDDQTLFWHRWLGISLGGLSFFAWSMKKGYINLPRWTSSVVIGLLVLLLSVIGHLGGNLTHGSSYLLQYAPDMVKKLANFDSEETELSPIPMHPDSIYVFENLVYPFLKTKCVECHGNTKTKGGLNLLSKEGIELGGDHGQVIEAGKAYESELFLRATLPQNETKFMPPKGVPLSYSELKVLEWWIENGASFEAKLTTDDVPVEVQALLLRDYGIDCQPKRYYDIVQVATLPESDIEQLRASGLAVNPLSVTHNFLEAKPDTKTTSIAQIQALTIGKEQITWLNLSNKSVEDNMLSIVGGLANLTKLNLSNNPISDDGIFHLKGLKNLEVLNLYNTEISDESIATLTQLPALKKLYLWQTEISNSGVDEIKKVLPSVAIELGV